MINLSDLAGGSGGTPSALEAAKTASMTTALNLLTAYTNLPYGFYDTFSDLSGVDTGVSANYLTTLVSLVPALTTNTATELGFPFSTAASSNPAWYAFESTEVQAFISTNSTASAPQILGYYFATETGKTVASFRLRVRTTTAAGAPYTFALQGSNDTTTGLNGTWTDLYTQTGTPLVAGQYYAYAIPTPAVYRAYRLHATKVGNNADGTFHIADFKLYDRLFVGGAVRPTLTGGVVDVATVVSTADTALVAPSYAMGMVWLDAKGAMVTDATETNNAIRLSISRDNGSTWDWLPLTNGGVVSGDVRLYSCAEKLMTATSGTSIRLKLTSHDLGSGAPDFELHGWGCVYDEGA